MRGSRPLILVALLATSLLLAGCAAPAETGRVGTASDTSGESAPPGRTPSGGGAVPGVPAELPTDPVVAAPTAVGPRAEVTASSFTWSYGTTRVVGVLLNTGTENLDRLRLTVRALDGTGRVVGEQPLSFAYRVLAPGQGAVFEALIPDRDRAVERLDFDLLYNRTPVEPISTAGLALRDVETRTDTVYHFNAVVVNGGAAAVTNGELGLALYDEAGRLLDVSAQVLPTPTLAPGATTEVSFTFDPLVGPKVATYRALFYAGRTA